MTKTPILRVRNLCKTYNRDEAEDLQVRAVSDVSFELYADEFVCITGESGSGKSTLLHCLGSFEEPDPECMDSVEFLTADGEYASVWENAGWYRQNFIGVVFQFFHLLPNLRIWENVEIPLLLSKSTQWEPDRAIRRARVQETLRQLAIEDKEQSRIGEVAGGQCQRAAIARALVKRPRLILADEPTGNLDEKTTGVIVQELKRLRDQGVAVLMVTHNLKIAKEYADRIIVLRDGRVKTDQRVPRPAAPQSLLKELKSGCNDTSECSESGPLGSVTTDESSGESGEQSGRLAQNGAAQDLQRPNDSPGCSPHVGLSQGEEMQAEGIVAGNGQGEPQRGATWSRAFSWARSLWASAVQSFRRLRIPGSELHLVHLLRFAFRDARESYTSLFTNVTAILFGTVLSASLLGLVFGAKKIMWEAISTIPNIQAVNVWIDYSTGAEPMTQADVDSFLGKPGVQAVVPEVKQLVYMYESEPKDYLACLSGTQPKDPEVERLTLVKGTSGVDPNGWDVILTEQVAAEINYFDPHGLVGKTVTMEIRRYGDLNSPETTVPTQVLKYPLKVVGIVKFSPSNRVYASMNLVRFARDVSTSRSKYVPVAGGKIDGHQISNRTFYEGLKLHYASPQEAEKRFLELRKEMGAQYEVGWLGQEYLWLRDVQFIGFLVFACFGLLTVTAGSISVFNTLQASVMRKTREIGILRSLGVSRMDVFSIFVMQSLIIGLLAGIGGLLVTLVGIPSVNRTVGSLAEGQWKLAIDLSTLIVLPGAVALSILLVVSLVCMVAAFYPSWRAGRITPMDAIRAGGQ